MSDVNTPDSPPSDVPEPAGAGGAGGAADAPQPGAAQPGAAQPAASGVPKLGLQAKVLVGALLLVAAVALFWPRGSGSFEAPGGFLTDASGRPQTLGPRMTPVTLVHFWATWCPPCLSEAPSMGRLIQDYSVYPQLTVLLVAVGDDIAKVQTFLGERSSEVLYDPNWDVAHRYGTHLLPETYLVVHGQVVEKWEGAQNWDDASMRRRIDAALAEVGVDAAATPRGGDGAGDGGG